MARADSFIAPRLCLCYTQQHSNLTIRHQTGETNTSPQPIVRKTLPRPLPSPPQQSTTGTAADHRSLMLWKRVTRIWRTMRRSLNNMELLKRRKKVR
ncbi:hypothetical protein ACSBR1_017545 [Camellia fascicularis]